MTDTSVRARTEAEPDGATCVRSGPVSIWWDPEALASNATRPAVTLEAHGPKGDYEQFRAFDTPELRAAFRALVRVWDGEEEAGE